MLFFLNLSEFFVINKCEQVFCFIWFYKMQFYFGKIIRIVFLILYLLIIWGIFIFDKVGIEWFIQEKGGFL